MVGCVVALSWKRTVLLVGVLVLVLLVPVGVEADAPRRDFLAGAWRVEEEGRGGLVAWVVLLVVLLAWAKSAARVGSLGCVRVFVVAGEEKPWNWAIRSSNCFWRPGRESLMFAAFLF